MFPGAHDLDRTALIMGDAGTTLTYGELDRSATRIANALQARGIGPGDHVAFCVENRPEFFELAWALHTLGVYYTAVSTRLTGPELAYIVEDCGAKAFFLSVRYADKAEAVSDVEHRFSVGGDIAGYEPLTALVAGVDETPPETRVAGRDMLYSSGTTGRPKGIKPRTIDTPLEEAAIIVTPVLEGMLGVGPDDVYLSPAPMYHAAPLRFSMAIHQLGGTVVCMERWDPERALELIERHGVTCTQMVPTMFVRMLRLPAEARAARDVSSLRLVIHAGAPCPPAVKDQMIDWLGPVLHEYYASTEGCGLTWMTPDAWKAHHGSVGKPLIGVAHIVGEDGEEVAAGQTGAVWFSDGPQFEYHNDPAKTAEATDARGWQGFGDIGHLDEDGYLFLTDRASFTIISGGVNVYPQETEDTLASHPAVLDAAVFGVPHEDLGEAVQAVVQPVEWPSDEQAFTDELAAYLKERLSTIKCPKGIDLRAELPRHDTGKLYKRLLKDEYAAKATA